MYVYLKDNIVYELIPTINPVFPNVPIEQRYTSEFLSHCVYTDEEVEQGWVYFNGHFYNPENEE